MSAEDLANNALARRSDFQPVGDVPKTAEAMREAASGVNAPKTTVSTALGLITAFIPIEVLTLYVAVLAAVRDPTLKTFSANWIAFFFFLVATPLVVWVLFATKIKAVNKRIPFSPRKWPLWEMGAGTISYLAWAFALPESPFSGLFWYSSALAGVVVLLVSTALALVAPLFQRPLKP
jgi:hypothetical protein